MRAIFKTTALSALLILTGLQTVVAAEGQFYVAPGIQWMDFDDSVNMKSDEGYFFGLGYDITDRFSGEISVYDLDLKNSIGADIDLDHYKFNVFYDLNRKIGQADTFVVAGMGNTDFGNDKETTWDIGAGIEYQLTDRISWRTAVRNYYHLSRDHEDSDFGIDSALIFRFGGSNSRPVEASPSRPATQTAVTDSDGDGVPDSRDNCADTPRNYAVDSIGCPIEVEEIARVELLVNFDFDKSEVKSQYFSEIEEVADFMNEYADVIIELEGHTDSRGTDQYNQGLSERRVNAVRQVLVERFNIQASRISTLGLGEAQAIASNDTDAGRARNRRVVTVVIKTLQNFQTR